MVAYVVDGVGYDVVVAVVVAAAAVAVALFF